MADQEHPWVRLIGSLILGASGVLAAMVPLYCAKQKSLDTQVVREQTDQSQIQDLRREVAALQGTISTKESEMASLRHSNAASPCTNLSPGTVKSVESSQPSPPDHAEETTREMPTVIERGIRFQLKSCAISGSTVQCGFLVTSTEKDRQLELYRGRLTRVIDESGNEYIASRVALGSDSSTNSFADAQLPGDVPIGGSLQAEGVKPGTKTLQLVEGFFRVKESNESHDLHIKFARVAL